MKNILIVFSIFVLTFLGCTQAPPETIEQTEKELVGTWTNERGNSSLKFYSRNTGVNDNDESFEWKVTAAGEFSIKIYPNLSYKETVKNRVLGRPNYYEFSYKFSSLKEFVHESGTNTFKKIK